MAMPNRMADAIGSAFGAAGARALRRFLFR